MENLRPNSGPIRNNRGQIDWKNPFNNALFKKRWREGGARLCMRVFEIKKTYADGLACELGLLKRKALPPLPVGNVGEEIRCSRDKIIDWLFCNAAMVTERPGKVGLYQVGQVTDLTFPQVVKLANDFRLRRNPPLPAFAVPDQPDLGAYSFTGGSL